MQLDDPIIRMSRQRSVPVSWTEINTTDTKYERRKYLHK